MTTHKAIREALEAGPTEGPWISQQGQNQMVNPGTTIHHGRGWGVYSDADEHGPDGADAAFIAACNPAAIRALLADLDAKTAEVERETAGRREAQEQLYAARERHTAEVKKLQAEIGRLQALRPVAMTEWQQLDAARLNSEEFTGLYWLAMKYGEVAVGEYEWRQGWNPHGFNLIDGGRVGASEVTHTIPFVKPALPHGIAQKERDHDC